MNYNKDLRYEVLKILQVITITATLLASFSNFINQRPFHIVVQPLFATLFILLLWFFQSKNDRNRYLSKLVFLIFFNVIYLPVAWYYSPGTSSAIGYYAILTIVVSVFFVEQIIEMILPIFGLAVSIFMIRYEGINPDHFEAFANKEVQINDVTTNFIVVVILLFIIITYINRHYVLEKERFYKLSITDDLTGVYNRRYLINVLEQLTENKEIESNFSLLFIDVNHFKKVNDTYGHHKGDEVLIKLGQLMQENFNVSGRFGGDEFIAIITDKSEEDVNMLSDDFKNEFKSYALDAGYLDLSLSIGMISGKDKKADEIIREADKNMYKMKHSM